MVEMKVMKLRSQETVTGKKEFIVVGSTFVCGEGVQCKGKVCVCGGGICQNDMLWNRLGYLM